MGKYGLCETEEPETTERVIQLAAKNIYCFNRKCLCANCAGYCPMCEHSLPGKCKDGVYQCEHYQLLPYDEYLKMEGYEHSPINQKDYYFKEE